MLPFIMFDSMHSSGIRNIFKYRKWYKAPCARKKRKGGLWPLVETFKNNKDGRNLECCIITYRNTKNNWNIWRPHIRQNNKICFNVYYISLFTLILMSVFTKYNLKVSKLRYFYDLIINIATQKMLKVSKRMLDYGVNFSNWTYPMP